MGRANTFSFLFLLLTSRKYLKCSSSFTLFLSAGLSLIYILCFTSVCLVPPKLIYEQLLYLFLVSSYILPSFLDYAIPPYSSSLFCYFLSYIQPCQLWLATSFLAYSLLYIAIFPFSRLYLFLRGYIPIPALSTVLLVVLEHPGTFLAAVVCTVSSCLTNFAFPSHSSPAYSSFGTITLIRIHLLILV